MSLIYINSYQFAGPTDPYFSNVSLLLHGDGTNGSTTIVDSSPSPKTVTAVGDAQISTAQSKFGGSSLAFDGNGDYLTATSSLDFAFGTGDFTMEAWVRPGSSATYQMIVTTRADLNSTTDAITLYVNSGTSVGAYSDTFLITGGTLTLNSSFYHIALSRSASNLRLFVDGIQVGSTVVNTQNFSRQTCTIAANADGTQVFGGYIDDLRVTKGVARYTSNFTPPTAPFPDA